ncbi:MAG: hypothetical protein GF317_06885 [Candidatus Lokiarchaeota archaeon]|nr:hypothetical protein [Candidatus Lokiarchaeota archaeon]MBD3199435.1 hypothetical protein [Candidatus Lokiarchaeota archaeon]
MVEKNEKREGRKKKGKLTFISNLSFRTKFIIEVILMIVVGFLVLYPLILYWRFFFI